MNYKLLAFATIMAFPFISVAQDLRDPFSRGGNSVILVEDNVTTEVNDHDVTPLTRDPITSYQVAGIIIKHEKEPENDSENDSESNYDEYSEDSGMNSIALIRTKNKRDYFASIGDYIGNEGGIIDEITSEGIVVDINGRLRDLNVSNRFDIQNESD